MYKKIYISPECVEDEVFPVMEVLASSLLINGDVITQGDDLSNEGWL